jgi:predicted Zn-dependent protease
MCELSELEKNSDVADPEDCEACGQIEIGWIVAGRLDAADIEAVRRARDDLTRLLQQQFPEFDWQMPLVEREEMVQDQRVEPVVLLDQGATVSSFRRWDFILIITAADLVSHYQRDAFAVLSRSLQATAISTARIDPHAYNRKIAWEPRVDLLATRISVLAMHAIGHLAGLQHDGAPNNYMTTVHTLAEVDRCSEFRPEQKLQFRMALRDVADHRLEEQTDVRRTWKFWFYLRASWINRRQLAKAVWKSKPWQFPFRLSRLSTAATAAMLVLMTTAEAWELGLRQSAGLLAGLAAFAVVTATVYVLLRQGLFRRRERGRLSESLVVTNVSTFLVVLAGMTTTFTVLCFSMWTFAWLFVRPEIVTDWVAAIGRPVSAGVYLKLATFVASLGLFLGALGASFEQQHYFRHITFVDEEM